MAKALFRQTPWRTHLITNSPRNTCYALLFFTSLSRSLPITSTTTFSFLASTTIATSRTSLSRPVHLTVQRRRFWLWLPTRGRGAPPVSPSARSQLSLHMPSQHNIPPKNDAGDNTFFYDCILQRDSSQYKTLKRVECVCHLVRSRIELADFSGSHLLVQVLPCFRGNFVLSRPTKFFSFFAHQDERE